MAGVRYRWCGFVLVALKCQGHALTATNAQGGEAFLGVTLDHFMQQRHQYPATRRTDRVAQGDGTAVDVDLAGVPVEFLADGQGLQISSIPSSAGCATSVYIAPANSAVFQLAKDGAADAMAWDLSPDDLGMDLGTLGCDPLPAGCDVVQAWRGRMYAALPMPGQTAIFYSKPLGFHLFDTEADAIMVPGRVLMLAPHDLGLVIGTAKAIHAYDGERLPQIAPYGVVPGWHWSADDTRILFWTQRGACQALPFANLTEKQISVAPCLSAGGAVVSAGG